MRLRVLLLSLLVLATACAGGTAADESTAIDPDNTSAEASADDAGVGDDVDAVAVAAGSQAPAAVPEVLDFQASSVSGEPVAGGDFAGQDLMVWFWAPW